MKPQNVKTGQGLGELPHRIATTCLCGKPIEAACKPCSVKGQKP